MLKLNIRLLRLFGIPIEINVSWLFTLAFVTIVLALRFYPSVLPDRQEDNLPLHWGMGLASGLLFFTSIIFHELAHSLMAKRFGIEVKAITLFLFGGVSQIAGEAKRPGSEFLIAVVGPLASLVISGVCFLAWWLTGSSETNPAALVLQWLVIMNLVVAVFNMAPGFPMDGGRVLRALLWGVSGNMVTATRIATVIGRGMGYAMMVIGGLAFLGLLDDYVDPYNGLWFILLGMFLESSSKQSWFQTRAVHALSAYMAADIMNKNLLTAYTTDAIRYLRQRAGRFFIFFVVDQSDDRVVGVVTEREVDAAEARPNGLDAAAGEVMVDHNQMPTISMTDDGASILQRMEAVSAFHMPVVDDGRVVGVVSKDSLMRILAERMYQLPRPTASSS